MDIPNVKLTAIPQVYNGRIYINFVSASFEKFYKELKKDLKNESGGHKK